MKIALLSARSGYIDRGVEKWSYELYKRLPYEVKVFSLADTEWTTKVKGFKRTDPEYKRYLLFYNTLERVRKIHPLIRRWCNYATYLVPHNTCWLSDGDGEVLSYAWNLLQALESFAPDLIINHTGSLVGGVVRKYRKKHHVPFMAVGGSGIGFGEYRNAKTMPNTYIAQTPANQMYISQRVPGLRVELIPNGFDVGEFIDTDRKFSKQELSERNRLEEIEWTKPYILSTSHFDWHKRLDRLIDAVAEMEEGTLIFTGEGPAQEPYLP
jgi:glycosyltransferase involved in cell wall biosynthesis